MKVNKKLGMMTMALSLSGLLVACGEDETTNTDTNMSDQMEETMDGNDHSGMDMSGSGDVPEGLKSAENPTFAVGDKAIITEAHMPGMEGAEATIVGAYDTVVYSISYDPMHGGERVEDHKWIIHEEIVDAKADAYEPGDEVTVDAEHMNGMGGATATIDSSEETTVYMVDFELDNGERVTNHKWVTEDELSAE
ncbi:YdhK family protein [Exiguobacterium alkaliphilum]|uniref:YdhK family protein n=1 Tax=Exiguobacterium alkaliphilum TaxID=1428684 RepID=UPI001BA8B41B|nr:YdhK family protein [Exiguobacterium alkaliphilum]QUE87114.1 YdhK family protein [Exiguobacterium alkaliphilum]